MAGIIVGIIFAAVAGGFAAFLHDFGILAEDLYPWGKDGQEDADEGRKGR